MSGTTWSVSGGKGINTPIGGEQLVDGGLEGAYTAGLHTSFTKAGSPTVAQSSDSHSGTKAQSFASTTGSDMIDTSPADTVGQWKRVSVWAKQSSIGAGRVNLAKSDGANFMLVGTISSGSYTKYVRTYRAIASGNNYIRVYAPAGGSDTVIVDDLSLQTLNLSDLLSLHPSSTPDVFAGIDITVIAGTQVGLALNWDSSSNPQNGVLVYFDGTNCKIDKCVAGVWTNVLSSAATVSRLIVGKIASSYRVYTPTALIGSVTIADAGIVNNTLHGLFSTYEGNTVDNWTVYASGSSGEYATAFDIVLNSSATERSGDYAAMSTVMELPSGVIEHGSDNDHGLLGTGLRSVIEATVYGPSSLN